MNNINTPQIKLPQGGGSVRGADENFSAQAFTGTASLGIPLPLPAGRGISPSLSVGYSSGSGNGLLGMGFHLSESAVSIKTNRALPKYDGTDVYMLDDTELVPQTESNTVYLERHQASFALIEKKITDGGNVYWQVRSNDNTVTIYGSSPDTQIVNPDNATQIYKWLISEQTDAHGNKVKYNYEKPSDDSNIYLTSIEYSNYTLNEAEHFVFKVYIDYGQIGYIKHDEIFTINEVKALKDAPKHPAILSNHRAGFLVKTEYLIKNIFVQHYFEKEDPKEFFTHCTTFEYNTDANSKLSCLKRVTEYALKKATGKVHDYTFKALPSIDLEFSSFPDLNGKQLTFTPIVDDNGPINQLLNFIDFHKEGMAGVMYRNADTLYYSRPKGNGTYSKSAAVNPSDTDMLHLPNQFANPHIPLNLVSLEGNGELQIEFEYAQNSGYFPLNKSDWGAFTPFSQEQVNHIPYRTEHVDVSGGNRADQLIISPQKIYFRASEGLAGMSSILEELENPNGVEAENQNGLNPYVYYGFADFFGDGLSHRIKIEDGQLQIWPSLGYGKFGKKITVNIPQFDIENQRIDLRKRLILADVNGSGTSDIVLLFPDRIQVYFNQNGNGFTDSVSFKLPNELHYSEFDHVQFHDVVGNGNPCLVFSKLSPHVFGEKYYDIAHYYCELKSDADDSPCCKPFLLRTINNNMGLVSTLTYKSSLTDYFLLQKSDGAWQTRLPFPTIVLKTSSIYDAISDSTFTSAYTYRNGYYDPNEHSFVGFGNVWQYDILDATKKINELQNTLHKTWFHLGLGQGAVQNEYYQGDKNAPILPLRVIENGLENNPEALFALAGSELHAEVYQTDYTGSKITNPCPYSTASSCTTVLQTQASTSTSKGVFKTYTNESIAVHYEQRANDPLVSHHTVIALDEYFHVLRDASVAYPRRKTLIDEQGVLHIAASEHGVYNQATADRYIGISLEGKSYEIGGFVLPKNGNYYGYDELKTLVDTAFANVINYSSPIGTSPYARLLSWERSNYWADANQTAIWDHTSALTIVLPHHSESIVFDDKNLEDILGGKISQADCKQASYVFDGGYYWVRTAVAHYQKQAGFYLLDTVSYDWVDENNYLYTKSSVKYDDYWLLPKSSATRLNDKVNITTAAEIDYRLLTPWRITDANGNTSEVLTDELGMVVATASYEKDGTTHGDAPLSDYQPKAVEEIADVFANPLSYIQQAGSFFYYRFPEYDADTKQWTPAFALSLVRTVYKTTEEKDIQRAIAYSDGLGRAIESRAFVGDIKVENSGGTQTPKANQWLASGRVIYNAKGEVTASYLPFAADTWQYLPDHAWHDSIKETLPPPTTFLYDATGRNYQVNTPKGFFSRTLILNAWETQHFDESDTVLESVYYKKYKDGTLTLSNEEKDALEKSIAFYNTPHTPVIDSLGRQVLAVSSNAMNTQGSDAPRIDWAKEHLNAADIDAKDVNLLVQWQSFDIQGRVLKQADARLNEANQTETNKSYNFQHHYPIAGGMARSWSADAGENCSFADAQGNVLMSWDALGNRHTMTYDHLHRPLAHAITKADDGSTNTITAAVYAENQATTPDQFEELKNKNSVGQALALYDNAGLVQNAEFTFDGHALQSTRKFRTNYKTDANWEILDPVSNELETEVFLTEATFDAAGRPLTQTLPDGSQTTWRYGIMGSCRESQITVQGKAQPIVTDCLLNQYGELVQVNLSNGVTTTHAYDALTREIKQIKSEQGTNALQNQSFWHDATGLITTMQNNVTDKAFYHNQQIAPSNTYTYDALYRLTSATGRIQLSRTQAPLSKEMHEKLGQAKTYHAADLQALGNYTENYQYDKGNNLTQLRRIGDGAFTRTYTIAQGCNRVTQYQQGQEPTHIAYDEAGQMKNINGKGSQKITWNTLGNIATATLVDRGHDDKNDLDYYVYDASGIRVHKVTVRRKENGTIISTEDKRYVGSYRRTTKTGTNATTRHHLTVGGVQKHDCVLMYSTDAQGQVTADGILYRYQHANHLNSVGLETNQAGDIISYEEFSAFGDTVLSYDPANLDSTKEYRYSAQERDDTTGLYYYGYRYYAPWLCRWTKPDPAGTIDDFNLYAFVGNDPIGKVDVLGLVAQPSRGTKKTKNYNSTPPISCLKSPHQKKAVKALVSLKKMKINEDLKKNFTQRLEQLAAKTKSKGTSKLLSIANLINKTNAYEILENISTFLDNNPANLTTRRHGNAIPLPGTRKQVRMYYMRDNTLNVRMEDTKAEGGGYAREIDHDNNQHTNLIIDEHAYNAIKSTRVSKKFSQQNVQTGRERRSVNLAQICGIDRADYPRNTEVLHIQACCIGGDNVLDNLKPGPHALNTAMIPIEGAIKTLKGSGVAFNVNIEFKMKTKTFSQGNNVEYVEAIKMAINIPTDNYRRSVYFQTYTDRTLMLSKTHGNAIRTIAEDIKLRR